jgi:hypothetical protein
MVGVRRPGLKTGCNTAQDSFLLHFIIALKYAVVSQFV